MNIGVVIPTVARVDDVRKLLAALAAQSLPPVMVVISVPEDSDLAAESFQLEELTISVEVVAGPKGALAQRNTGAKALPDDADLVVFFDDDVIPRNDYLSQAASYMNSHPDVVAINGKIIADGGYRGAGLRDDQIVRALEDSRDADTSDARPSLNLSGSNITIRHAAILEHPFDERLPLYSWLEDADVARRLQAAGGGVHLVPSCVIAHRGGATGSKDSHVRFGYSQIANAVYLTRKGSLPARELIGSTVKPVLRTVAESFAGENREWRRARLRGNLLAIGDVLRGRVTPERILDL